MKTAHENVSSLCARFFSLSSLVSTVSEAVMLTEELAEVVLGYSATARELDPLDFGLIETGKIPPCELRSQSITIGILFRARAGTHHEVWIHVLPGTEGIEPAMILRLEVAKFGLDDLSDQPELPPTLDHHHLPLSALQCFVNHGSDVRQTSDDFCHVLRPLVDRVPIFDLEEIECREVGRSNPPTLDVEERKRPLRVDLLADKLVRTTALTTLETTNSVMCHG